MKSFFLLLFTTFLVSCHSDSTEINANETSLERILNGNIRFVNSESLHIHHDLNAVTNTSKKQNPFAVVLTCSDSRVDPNIIFDQGIGDLFVVKNAGNLISDIDYGTIEYAVEHLGVKLIVIMGHTDCGAVKAFVSDKDKHFKKHHSHIDDILTEIESEDEIKALSEKNTDYLTSCITANTLHSAKMIANDELIKKYKVKEVKLLYNVQNGKVTQL